MDFFRLMIGMFASMTLGAMGLFLYMMKVTTDEVGKFLPPSPQYINVHFLGQFLIVMAAIMLLMTFLHPSVTQPSLGVKKT